ncbi:MAG: hypothetical protein LBJ97_01920 [Mycoplasmataceae bacterium]|nr:hypothetical protein [Mycoplasmataceae bacterium]
MNLVSKDKADEFVSLSCRVHKHDAEKFYSILKRKRKKLNINKVLRMFIYDTIKKDDLKGRI